jgi:hypothetical protein
VPKGINTIAIAAVGHNIQEFKNQLCLAISPKSIGGKNTKRESSAPHRKPRMRETFRKCFENAV